MRIPSASPVRPSSSPEQSIPLLTTPIFSVRSMRRSPGRTAPGSATGTRWPGAMFVAPQTISSGSPLPTVTRVSDSRSARGCLSTARSSPTTTFCQSVPAARCPSLPSRAGSAARRGAPVRARRRCSRAARTAAPSSGRLRPAWRSQIRDRGTHGLATIPCRRHPPLLPRPATRSGVRHRRATVASAPVRRPADGSPGPGRLPRRRPVPRSRASRSSGRPTPRGSP